MNRAQHFVWAASLALLAPASSPPPPAPAPVVVSIAKTSLRFEANAGQWDSRARFVARDRAMTLFVTDEGATMEVRSGSRMAVVRMKLEGTGRADVRGERELDTKSNYFVGEPSRWRTHVANFSRVRSARAVPGVDVVWHGGNDGELEYDLEVGADADARALAVDIDGASALDVGANGELRIETELGTITQAPPNVFQDDRALRARYRVEGGHRVRFEVDGYDRDRPLLIDPVLVYSTYLNGNNDDFGVAIAVDAAGNAYVAGQTPSTDFPTKGAYQATIGGSYDAMVLKLAASGSALVYATYLGGSGGDEASGVAVDGSGNAYVVGDTSSSNYPTTNAYQSSLAGGHDAFVTKLDASGATLVYSTYLGGTTNDYGYGVAVDGTGNAYVVGSTGSSNFPTKNAYQSALSGGGDAFVTKLSTTGSLVYSTYLGGSGGDDALGVAVDSSGNACVTGELSSTNFPTKNAFQASYGGGSLDAFVTKLDATGSSLVYSTYLGGGFIDEGKAIAVDPAGDALIAGLTQGGLPTKSALQATFGGVTDGFVTKLDASGGALYSTFLGVAGDDEANGIATDTAGNAYVAGYTFSNGFPTVNAVQSTYGGAWDAFVSKLDSTGKTLAYSTYFGGAKYEIAYAIAVDSSGNAYFTGATESSDFPTKNPYQSSLEGGGINGTDAFVVKIGVLPLVIAPSTINLPPKGSQTFAADGGAGGYVFSLQANASGGAIDSTSGAYVAGATGSVTDIVEVKDAIDASTTASVNVGPAITLAPPSASTVPGGQVTFVATGGSGVGYTWSLATNASGGKASNAGGVYTAGSTGAVVDVVQVTDSLGNTAQASVSVGVVDAGVEPDAAPDAGVVPEPEKGCSCTIVARSNASGSWVLVAGMVVVFARRRRVRRARRASALHAGS